MGDGPDAVIFDLDGVITFTARVHAAAWKELFDDYLRAQAARIGAPRRLPRPGRRRVLPAQLHGDGRAFRSRRRSATMACRAF